MIMKKFNILFSIFLLLLLSICDLSAQELTPVMSKKSDIWLLDSPKDWPGMIRPGIRGRSDRSLYYSDFLIPTLGTKETLLFVNPKLVWDNHNTNEQNIGIGLRNILFDDSLILGANLYYDTQKSQYRNRFNQLGFGLEALSKWIDLRANFYFPQSSKKEIDQDISYKFASKSLKKLTVTTYEEPLRGIDYEAGILLPYISDYVETRAFIGGYNYSSKIGPDINGIKARLEIKPSPLLTFDLEVTDDNTSSVKTYVGGYVTLPFSLGNLFSGKNPFEGWQEVSSFGKGPRPLRKRMTDMVIRDIDVLLNAVKTDPVVTTEIDGLTYVDNSNTTGIEDGSYENPYADIQAGVDNATGDKWVYVREGSSAYEENVALNDDLTLWGSGYNGGFNGITATGYPVITEYDDIVVLADKNTVMGLRILGVEEDTANRGIVNSALTTTGTIKYNIINVAGSGVAFNNNLAEMHDFVISNNTFLPYGDWGWSAVDLSYNAGTITNFTIANNICDDLIGAITLSWNNFGSEISGVTISGNRINNNLTWGIEARRNYGTISGLVISGNTISGSRTQDGVALSTLDDGSISEVTFYYNTIANNAENGINITGDNITNINLGSSSSGGSNSIYDNTEYDVNNLTGATISAQYNWWGQASGPDPLKISGDIDYAPWLTSDPNL
jgi:hypothetical protein